MVTNKKYTLCDPDMLRQLCVKYDWFAEGTETQYEKFFHANEMDCPVEEMITMIWLCSDQERWCRRDIRFTLIEEGLMDDFRIDVVAEGSFKSEGYLVQTFTVRVDPFALNDWQDAHTVPDREWFDSDVSYIAELKRRERGKEQFESYLKRGLCIEGHMTYERVVSEIFAVVHMEKLTD